MANPRFKNLEFKIGLFVLLAILIIIVAIISIGVRRNIFVNKINIFVYTETGEEVTKGMPVKYSGFQITRVDSVQLQDDGRVVIKLGIPTKYAKWVKQNSTFKLGAQNIIGNGYIMILTDLDNSSPTITTGDTFTLERDQGIQAIIEQATPVIENLKEIVANVNVILGNVADKDGDVNKILKGIGALGDDIVNKEGSLGFLTRTDYVKDEVVIFLNNLKTFSEEAIKVAKNVEKGSSSLDKTLVDIANNSEPILVGTKDFISDLQDISSILTPAIEKLSTVIDQLNITAQNTALGTENLDELRAEIQSIVENGNELLLKIQNTWPLKTNDTPNKVPLK